MTKSLVSLVLAACSFSNGASSMAQDGRLRVVLDPTTFAGPTYQLMQDTADHVAHVVEQLIPEGWERVPTPETTAKPNMLVFSGDPPGREASAW
jgi:hypothetical protein